MIAWCLSHNNVGVYLKTVWGIFLNCLSMSPRFFSSFYFYFYFLFFPLLLSLKWFLRVVGREFTCLETFGFCSFGLCL
ncbi:hypothetical protein BDV34DRAFT_206500 [Aspergillus parasiticus]|uniref:Uncharacterized protein n=1 Tax=Aspergillus parasiticus TaxID=5067 RepID=A0A5N6D3G0_ASPPA|nr:hypothetical protein BDV34DRAFT_206500 [Aspergillus parasiticus]